MADLKRVGDLEIAEDMAFQERDWRVQRVGWVVMALIAAAALLGLFGPGLLNRVVETSGPLEARFRRFERNEAPTSLELSVSGEATRGGTVRVWLSREYLSGVDLDQVTPEPARVTSAESRLVYEFPVRPGGDAIEVSFQFQPARAGVLRGRVGLEGGPSVPVSQFVYP
jgi:hypothetical protein